MKMIPFNKPHVTGREIHHLQALFDKAYKFSGNGEYTQKCHDFFKKELAINHCLMTNSCTDALEMSAILCDIKEGDEIIMPSYTFVSTANAFILRGANIKFVDSLPEHPNLNAQLVEELITDKTKAIVVVHYAGIACDMVKINELCRKYNLYCIEDAAQAIGSTFQGKALGTLSDLSTFSFHETKNIICGEGGLLVVNNSSMKARSEIIWEKGTNRSAFFRGEVDKYNWVDIGSSFLPSELNSAFLLGQLEEMHHINNKRLKHWNHYFKEFSEKLIEIEIGLPTNPTKTLHNGHIFYLMTRSLEERGKLLSYLKENNVHGVFHYTPLHSSPYFKRHHDNRELPHCDRYANQLIRLPLWPDLEESQVSYIIDRVVKFYAS